MKALSVDGKGKRLARHSWSRRSTKWSADDSSRNSRCSGRCAGPIFCCRPGRGSSTRIWTTYSAVGIQNSGRNHKRRSQSARWLDPRLFAALHINQPTQSTLLLNPYLLFNGQCEAAFKFYEKCLGGKIVAKVTNGESPMAKGTSPGPPRQLCANLPPP